MTPDRVSARAAGGPATQPPQPMTYLPESPSAHCGASRSPRARPLDPDPPAPTLVGHLSSAAPARSRSAAGAEPAWARDRGGRRPRPGPPGPAPAPLAQPPPPASIRAAPRRAGPGTRPLPRSRKITRGWGEGCREDPCTPARPGPHSPHPPPDPDFPAPSLPPPSSHPRRELGDASNRTPH